MYLEKINGPEDVKKLTDDEMIKLAAEMRSALLRGQVSTVVILDQTSEWLKQR